MAEKENHNSWQAGWLRTEDGFSMCPVPLADILNDMGITDTGISELNTADVQSYYDDWHLYCIDMGQTVYSLLKMREQEHDYVPGYADMDNPGVTISFISFDIALLRNLEDPDIPREESLPAFVAGFRTVTDLPNQTHDPLLQQYFSDPHAAAPYLVAQAYLQKLFSLHPDGIIPLPENMSTAPKRIWKGLENLNRIAGKTIYDAAANCLRIADPAAPTDAERYAVLAVHTGNLTFNSFAAEVKFHADALIAWQKKIPILGKRWWYASAIRADMQVEPEELIRKTFFSGYYKEDGPTVELQASIHGRK